MTVLREATGETNGSAQRRHAALLSWLEKQIQQSGLNWTPGRVLVMAGALFAVGFLVGSQLRVVLHPAFNSIAAGLALSFIPIWHIRRMRQRRMDEFEGQFPEALEFLSRSMRAGHALTISLGLLSEDAADPLGGEFRKACHEHNLGAPLAVVLENLSDRMPLLDVRFFVSAVMLQTDTGGNLAEILTKLSYVIRERFRLRGQVKAASAHGRVTGAILMIMPIALAFGMTIVAPGYLTGMANDSDGRYIMAAAIAGQILGCLTIRKIIRIKV